MVKLPGFLLVLWIIGLCHATHAQQFRLETRGNFGFIIPHRVGVSHLIKGHVRSGELSIEKETSGDKFWQYKWRYPRVGLTYFFADLANPSQLGYAMALFPHIKFPVYSSNRFNTSIRVGGGLGYVTKRFDPVDNYKNVMVGSSMNIVANIVGECSYKISNRVSASAGLGFMHYSNGAFTIPNLGINIPSVTAAVNYRIGSEIVRIAPDSIPEPDKYAFMAYGTFGLKENYPISSNKFPVFAATAELSRQFGYRSRLITNLDVFHNRALRPSATEQGLSADINITQVGFMVGYGLVVDRLTMVVGQGIYAVAKYKEDGQFYHRLGVTYMASKRLGLRWMLKTHFFKADCFEFGLGYRIL